MSQLFWLEEGESPDDYSNTCECGGKLNYYDYIPLYKVYRKCPKCGFEGEMYNKSYKPLGCMCPNCYNEVIYIDDKCLICISEGKIFEQRSNVPMEL